MINLVIKAPINDDVKKLIQELYESFFNLKYITRRITLIRSMKDMQFLIRVLLRY